MSITTYGMMAWAGTGTGSLTGLSAITGVTGFPTITDGLTVRFLIFDAAGNFEESLGVSSSSGTAFTRVTVLRSSNAGAKVSFPGAATVQLLDLYPAGGGTVTSVSLSLPTALFANGGSTITGSGNLTDPLATQTKNTVLAGPASGSAATPTFRAMTGADLGFVTGDVTGQTATNSSVVTVTSPNDGNAHQYQVGAYVNVTAISAGAVTVTYTFTDEASNSRTLTLFPMGLTSAAVSATGFIAFPTATIRVKANTAITLVMTFTGVSVSFDGGGSILQLN